MHQYIHDSMMQCYAIFYFKLLKERNYGKMFDAEKYKIYEDILVLFYQVTRRV